MIMPVNVQIYYFLSTIFGGLLLGVLFDFYRITFNINKPNKLLSAISDLLFWILCTLCIFTFFLYTNDGNVRYYTFIGLFIGSVIYMKLISKSLIIVLRGITLIIMKILRVLLNLFKYPIKCIKYLIKYIQYYIKKLVNVIFSGITRRLPKEEERRE
jgi:spore cortex biosynthesis protein YabQ